MLDVNFENNVMDLLIKYRGIQSSIESTKSSIADVESTIKDLEREKTL